MKTRRDFLKLAASGLVASTKLGTVSAASAPLTAPIIRLPDDRTYWCGIAQRLATPILTALAQRRLKIEMPCEASIPTERRPFTHLEALGRLLCGLAPWFELPADGSEEAQDRVHFAALARSAIDAGTDPKSPDFMNFSSGQQPLVDAAFLAQAFLRAPRELWQKLEPRIQANVIAALKSSRPIQPGENNWKLFASEIEVFLHVVGEKRDELRLKEALGKLKEWYLGDSIYGDGPEFHWDYYNSFVIHPMLLETLEVVALEKAEWAEFHRHAQERLTRYAQIQERLIAPDGSFPAIGRSNAYRCGAFHALALASLRHRLPGEISPGQVRGALASVIRRTLEAPGTWDAKGWLQIGLAGHQPNLGEPYISTGSLYLCSAAFLPLGLPASDPFWSAPPSPTSWEKIWSGTNISADHAIKMSR